MFHSDLYIWKHPLYFTASRGTHIYVKHVVVANLLWRWSKNKRIQPVFKSMSASGSSVTTMQSYAHVPNTKKCDKTCNNASNVIIYFSSHISVLIIPKSHSESSLSLQRRCLIALFGASQMHLIKNVTHWTAAMIWSLKHLSHHVSDDSKWTWGHDVLLYLHELQP